MTEQEDTRKKSRRDLLLVLLILPLGVLCMFMTGQVAIKLAPNWVLNADMRSLLDPNATFAAQGNQPFIEPLNPGILTRPAWGDLFLTPHAMIPTREIVTREIVTATPPPPPVRTPQPPPVLVTPDNPDPTATVGGPIILPTRVGPLRADLLIEISDNSSTYTPGTSINYTIVVTNLGPDDIPRFNVSDSIPAVIFGLTVNCTPASLCGTNTSNGNNISFTGATLSSSGVNQITITVSGTVVSGATGNLVNTASVVIPSGVGVRDLNLANNTVTDTDTQLSVYDLAITKSDGVGVNTYTTTNPINYTIVVTNNGPSDALGISITDNIPPQIMSWIWICRTVVNAYGCNGVINSTTNFTDNMVNIVRTGRIEYTVTAYPRGISQNISNTANVVIPTGPEFTDPDLTNNSATDVNTPYIDLQITKTDVPPGNTYTPSSPVTYTVTVTNNSTFTLTGATLTDNIPTLIDPLTWAWTCAPASGSPGASCATSSGTGNINHAVNLPPGESVDFTINATVSSAAIGDLSNTATVSAPAGLVDALPGNNSATDINIPYIDLQITKDDGQTTYTPGGPLTYIVTVTNNSAFDLSGVTVTDNIPPLIDPLTWVWTCAPDPLFPSATCTASGTGNINDTVFLPAGASITYTINAIVDVNAVGILENTATVNPPAGFVDAVPGNNTAIDTDT